MLASGAAPPPPPAPLSPADAMLPPAGVTPAVVSASVTMRLRRPFPAREFAAKSSDPLFLRPTGLAVGLALKERRYGPSWSDSPQGLLSLWFPRSLVAGPRGIRQVHLGAAVYSCRRRVAHNKHTKPKQLPQRVPLRVRRRGFATR